MSDLEYQSSFATAARNVLAEEVKDRGADVVLAVFRLVKNAMIHSVDNAAVVEAAELAARELSGFGLAVGMPAAITYADKTVFICGQLLRASRGVYESALELGQVLAKVGVSELGFDPAVNRVNLQTFVRELSLAMHDAVRRDAFLDLKIDNVLLRKAEAVLVSRKVDDDLPMQERIIRFYATALVVMRRFLDEVAAGRTLAPHRVKRIGQRLVVLAESNDPAMLGLTAMAGAHRDDAGRALQTAIISVIVGREITQSRVPLARLAMAALMDEVGRARITGTAGRDQFVVLSDAEEARVPASTALVGIATGGVAPANALRVTTLFESAWLEREPIVGRVWGGTRAPLPQSEIITLARMLVAELAPRDARPGLSPAAALEKLAQDPRVPRTLLKLLVRVMGFIPSGTVVELETGEWAVVLGPSARQEAFPLPRIRVVTDRKGAVLDSPRTIDLGEVSPAQAPRIARTVEAEHTRFNVTKAFLS